MNIRRYFEMCVLVGLGCGSESGSPKAPSSPEQGTSSSGGGPSSPPVNATGSGGQGGGLSNLMMAGIGASGANSGASGVGPRLPDPEGAGGAGPVALERACGNPVTSQNGLSLTGVYPRGGGPGAVIMVTGTGLGSFGGQLLLGNIPITPVYKTDNVIIAALPATLDVGCVPLSLATDGPTADFQSLPEIPTGDWKSPGTPFVPRSLAADYIPPIDQYWVNEFDVNDAYFFQISGDPDATIVEFSNASPLPIISGTYDKTTGVFEFSIVRADAGTERFVGVYSRTDIEGLHRLVLFPDAIGGPQLVITVQQ
jgi:hypothetical protein